MTHAAHAHHDALTEALTASIAWIRSFNQGDPRACADAYAPNAWMHAQPFGRYEGTEAIYTFWAEFLKTGAGELRYQDVNVHVLDDNRVRLQARWSMNVGRGVISNELWVRQPSGDWKLVEDAFEVQEQYT